MLQVSYLFKLVWYAIFFHNDIAIIILGLIRETFNNLDGTKLPPICIFKEKQMPHGEQVPTGIVVWFQKNGWMDLDLMLKYVDYLNDIRSKNGTQRNSTMLVYDSFKGHLGESVKSILHKSGIDLAVIPGSLTSIC